MVIKHCSMAHIYICFKRKYLPPSFYKPIFLFGMEISFTYVYVPLRSLLGVTVCRFLILVKLNKIYIFNLKTM